MEKLLLALLPMTMVVGGLYWTMTMGTRVRQLRAQVIDLYSVARQTLHYNRVSWVVRVGLPTVRAPRMAACSLSMFERPAAGALPLSVTR